MKNKFRALALLLASIMMITACGQTTKEESKSSSSAVSGESAAVSTDKAAEDRLSESLAFRLRSISRMNLEK